MEAGVEPKIEDTSPFADSPKIEVEFPNIDGCCVADFGDAAPGDGAPKIDDLTSVGSDEPKIELVGFVSAGADFGDVPDEPKIDVEDPKIFDAGAAVLG